MVKSVFKIRDIVYVFIGALILTIIAQETLGRIPYFAQMGDDDVSGLSFLIVYLIQIVIFAVPLLLIMKRKDVFHKENFGFKKIPLKQILKYAFLGYFLYFMIALTIAQISISWDVEIPGFQQQESHIPFIGEQPLGAILVVSIITFFAPILEEIFFRGFVFKTMAANWPKRIVYPFCLSAFIFAAIHLEFGVILPLFILGIILNWMFYKTKSLYPGIFFHIINNTIALSIEYYVYIRPEILEMAAAATGSVAIQSPF